MFFLIMSTYSYCMFMYLHRANWHSSATLTEVFPCFFLSCKANARVKPRKDGARPALFHYFCVILNFCVVLCVVCFLSFFVLCVCVNVYCTKSNENTNLMQHCAGFISAGSLYTFRAQAPIIRSI